MLIFYLKGLEFFSYFSLLKLEKKAYIHEIKDYVIPTLILMAKVSNLTANPFIWMANSIGEIVEKQKNEKVIF
jgi:hypothetical protein